MKKRVKNAVPTLTLGEVCHWLIMRKMFDLYLYQKWNKTKIEP